MCDENTRFVFNRVLLSLSLQLLQVFESHAEHLGPSLFTEFSLSYIEQIQLRVRQVVDVPMVIFVLHIFIFGQQMISK